MTPEMVLYIIGVTLIPLLGWGIHIHIKINKISGQSDRLVLMHEQPDEYGFGTYKTNKIIEANTRAMHELTHYIKWLGKEQTGKEPPPPLPLS